MAEEERRRCLFDRFKKYDPNMFRFFSWLKIRIQKEPMEWDEVKWSDQVKTKSRNVDCIGLDSQEFGWMDRNSNFLLTQEIKSCNWTLCSVLLFSLLETLWEIYTPISPSEWLLQCGRIIYMQIIPFHEQANLESPELLSPPADRQVTGFSHFFSQPWLLASQGKLKRGIF